MTVIGWTGELAGQLGIEFAEDLDQLRADAGRLTTSQPSARIKPDGHQVQSPLAHC
jgi:hypothetical protein